MLNEPLIAEVAEAANVPDHILVGQRFRGETRVFLVSTGVPFRYPDRQHFTSTISETISLTTPSQYLRQSERGARHVFDGIAGYLRQYRELRWPAEATNITELTSALEDVADWQVAESSFAVLCAAALQLADIGLDRCSINESVPVACSGFAKSGLAKFCVGREVHGLPLGAIVHFGRVRMAGGAEARTRADGTFMRGVFDHLLRVYYTDSAIDGVRGEDAAYRGQPIRIDALVVSTIGWTSYETYLADMHQMLPPARRAHESRKRTLGRPVDAMPGAQRRERRLA